MNKKEVVKNLRKLLTEAARALPDTEYCRVSHCTEYADEEFDGLPSDRGNLHQIILIIEEQKKELLANARGEALE